MYGSPGNATASIIASKHCHKNGNVHVFTSMITSHTRRQTKSSASLGKKVQHNFCFICCSCLQKGYDSRITIDTAVSHEAPSEIAGKLKLISEKLAVIIYCYSFISCPPNTSRGCWMLLMLVVLKLAFTCFSVFTQGENTQRCCIIYTLYRFVFHKVQVATSQRVCGVGRLSWGLSSIKPDPHLSSTPQL